MAGTRVSLRSADRVFEGYLAKPESAGPHPGIVVIHEIFGLTPWLLSVADRLAAQGYVALAPDLYVGRIHPRFTPEVAQRIMPLVWQQPVEVRIVPAALRAALKGHREDDIEIALGLAGISAGTAPIVPMLLDLRAAVAALRSRPDSSGKVGAIGFCFGGKASFHLATVEPALDAAVVFYGAGPRELEIEHIRCPVLGLYGEDDEHITKDVPRVAAAMKRFGKVFEHEVYNRTGHAFARAGHPGYNDARATAAWARTDEFLGRHLKVR